MSAEAAAASNSASTYSVFLKEQARKNLQLVSSVEEKIAELVAQVTKNEKMKKTHSFPPMKSHQVGCGLVLFGLGSGEDTERGQEETLLETEFATSVVRKRKATDGLRGTPLNKSVRLSVRPSRR